MNKAFELKDTWLLYLILFFSYFIVGHFLSFISFQSQIVPIWLPAGIALAGCYLWWWRFFPAVFFGSFIFNCSVTPDFTLAQILSEPGFQNLLISSGAMLQAIVGAGLLRYWLGNPIVQHKGLNSLLFVFIVGLVVNLISASIGVFSLSTFNPLYDIANYQLNMTFWWLGDSLGVLLATPLILSLLHYKQADASQRKVNQLLISVILLVFFIVFAITKIFVTNSDINTKSIVKQQVKVMENGIYRQIDIAINELKALAAFIQNNASLDKVSFEQFVSGLNKKSDSVVAMSWNPLIQQNELQSNQTQLREIYHQQISINGTPLAAVDPVVYVKYIYPEKVNEKAIGYNVFSNPSRKKTIMATIENYQPKATPIIHLVQKEHPEPAFLIFFPVFEDVNILNHETIKQLKGFATAVVVVEKLINAAIGEQQKQLFFYEFFEENQTQSFASNINDRANVLLKEDDVFSYSFDVAGTLWQIELHSNKSFINQQKNLGFLNLFILLVIIVVIITTSLLLMHNRQLMLEQVVKERTSSLELAVKEANQANSAKSQFLANMSHEIRTPMNSVIGFSKLAKDSNDLVEIKSYLENIDVSSDLLMHIINDILDISKIESEKLVLSNEIIDLHLVFERIHRLFEANARAKGLIWEYEDNIPRDIYFKGDQTRIEQVLMNLCGNALKFTEQGRVTFVAELIHRSKHEAKIAIRIQDTGIGISPENINKLFKPFTQADESTSRHFGGTGLGLTIAKKLSQLMRGDIKISSIEGQGTIFRFTLTLDAFDIEAKNLVEHHQAPESQLTEPPTILPKKEGQKAAQDLSLSSLKVLVAEDNRINQKLINTVLTKLGIVAVIVENGQEAVEQVQKMPFDLVLMDCQMPVLDGYEATCLIRAIPQFEKLPIFALTADVDIKSKQRAQEIGFDKHLSKPLNIEELTKNLHEVVKQKLS